MQSLFFFFFSFNSSISFPLDYNLSHLKSVSENEIAGHLDNSHQQLAYEEQTCHKWGLN